MARDAIERDGLTGRPFVGATTSGHELVRRRRVAEVQPELPSKQALVRGQHHRRWLRAGERADRSGAEAVLVDPAGVRTDDRAVDSAVPAFPDATEAVD